jgi:hypothetical protein
VQWKGRGKKNFLYDIVANKRNGIDVDKFDYFVRDCHMLNITPGFDFKRLIAFARVYHDQSVDCVDPVTGEDNREVCYHHKEAWNIYEMFHTRHSLHLRAYQHQVAGAVEWMIVEALMLAEPYVTVPGKDGIPRRFSECVDDMHAYWKLGEYILKQIEMSSCPELAPSREIIYRLRKRDMYKLADSRLIDPKAASFSVSDVKEGLAALYEEGKYGHKPEYNAVQFDPHKDLFCNYITMGFGKKNEDPVAKYTTFFVPPKHTSELDVAEGGHIDEGEGNDAHARTNGSIPCTAPQPIVGKLHTAIDTVSAFVPVRFEELRIRVYCRHTNQKPLVKALFDAWCKVCTYMVMLCVCDYVYIDVYLNTRGLA